MFRVGSSGDGEFPRATSGFLGPNLKNSLQGLDMQVKRSEPCGVVKYYRRCFTVSPLVLMLALSMIQI
jgi:hypothetical protein